MPSSDGQTLGTITRNDGEVLDVVVYEPDGETPSDIGADTLRFEARYKVADELPVILKNHADLEIVDSTVGHARIPITKEDTSQIAKGLTLKCQLVVTDAEGREETTMFDLPVRYRR